MRWFPQRIMKAGPLLTHESQSHDAYYFSTFLGGGSLFQLFELLHFVLPISCGIHLLFLPFLDLVFKIDLAIPVFSPAPYEDDLDQGILLSFTHLPFSLWLEAELALRLLTTSMVSFE